MGNNICQGCLEGPEPPQRSVHVPFLYLLFDCEHLSAGSARHSLEDVDELVLGRGETKVVRTIEDGVRHVLVQVADDLLSERHACIIRTDDGHWLEDLGSKHGTVVEGTRVTRRRLNDGDVIELGRTFFLYRMSVHMFGEAVADLRVAPSSSSELCSLIPDFGRELDGATEVGHQRIPIAIIGESGTGKEFVARSLHAASERAGAFVSVNCRAISAGSIEAELRTAVGGTLFLDEVAALSQPAQVTLLRALLEERSTHGFPGRIGVITATCCDLDEMANNGQFHQALLARLSGFGVRLLPLRRRREDLGLIIAALAERIGKQLGAPVHLSNAAGRLLVHYDWPLNVRELKQCLTTAATVSEGTIGDEQLSAICLDASRLPASGRST